MTPTEVIAWLMVAACTLAGIAALGWFCHQTAKALKEQQDEEGCLSDEECECIADALLARADAADMEVVEWMDWQEWTYEMRQWIKEHR